MRTEYDAALAPDGRTDAAVTRAAGALLAPRLAAAAGDLVARLRARGACPAVREVTLDGLMEQRTARLDRERGRHVCAADLLA